MDSYRQAQDQQEHEEWLADQAEQQEYQDYLEELTKGDLYEHI